jgi:hypothetical protein
LKEGLLAELVLTAFDIQKYLREAFPALRAAIYRGDLSQAKDVLAVYDETIYGEWDLTQVLVEVDYSWVFTEKAADPEAMDPEGTLVGFAYPLILAFHHPDVFRARLGGSDLSKIFPFTNGPSPDNTSSDGIVVYPGYREGLRAMWEITGFLTPQSTEALRQYCQQVGSQRNDSTARLMGQMAAGLKAVVDQGYGLVLERD